ncbi:hypothetical protein ZOD2009_18809 [Haladaptatus paucihalophilus DX253]|uniref:Uncharacterized protein n=1 Tax=Haladaptatus paucihalophilus DX253 TaxID=797209 RepID=E7QY72_HALPU|nr:hypothetical protein ZOD2009_18809 [Haladaptatus paucihalophilus DX253]
MRSDITMSPKYPHTSYFISWNVIYCAKPSQFCQSETVEVLYRIRAVEYSDQ